MNTIQKQDPIKVFISYSHNQEDRPLLDQLIKHITPLVDAGKIIYWEDSKITPGGNRAQSIKENIEEANIIILLVSSDYLSSDYVNQIEVPIAIQRKMAGNCEVVPVLLRSCLFALTPYANYDFLPKTAHDQKLVPLVLWENIDDAFVTIVHKINELIMSAAIKTTKNLSIMRHNLPLRPSYFIGRNKDILNIHAKLTANGQENQIVLISGMGGIGKTALTQEYLYQPHCQEYFQRILAISVNRNLRNAFVFGVAEAFNLDMKSYPRAEDQLNLVIRTLKACNGQNLLLIDNINESDKDDLVEMHDHFIGTGWSFLISSRAVPDAFLAIQVNELDLDQVVSLFEHHYAPNIGNRRDIKKLLGHIHRHTLLTELIAKIGKKKGYSPAYLQQLLEKEDFKHPDMQRTISIGTHAQTSYRTEISQTTLHQYMLSLFEPEIMNEASQTMLRFFSVLPSDDMPIGDLKVLWRVEPPDENAFEDQLDELQQSGWLISKYKKHDTLVEQNLTLKMHPLVKEVVYEKLRPDIENCRPLVKTVTEILSYTLSHPARFQAYAKSIIDKLSYVNKMT